MWMNILVPGSLLSGPIPPTSLKGSGTLMTSLYREYAQSWDTCVQALTSLILKRKNVGWFLNQFGFIELGTLGHGRLIPWMADFSRALFIQSVGRKYLIR